ncbi:MAG TPA: glycosyltransferase [Bacteroidia bacterium]|nr:glycosyltransferase [Bacteroidia bacterium]
MSKVIIISVITDLVTDQRVHRAAMTLTNQGNQVVLVGRRLKKSLPLDSRPYKTVRFKLWFEKGPMFYASYNLRLFIFLMFNGADILLANDLDTLPANYLAARLNNMPLVYDSHEYFTEVPELENRPFVKKIWKSIEQFIFPQLKYIYTVNDSIAGLYQKEYNKKIAVVRNIPDVPPQDEIPDSKKMKGDLGIDSNKKIIILQGAGINIERGAEEAVEAMNYIDDAVLLIVGGGDVMPFLKEIVQVNKLEKKVIFRDKMPYWQLINYTKIADMGLTLDKNTNLNYAKSLPNKLFDYIHANIPVLGSQVTEVKKIIEEYKIGAVIENHDPEHIAEKIKFMLADESRIEWWKKNLTLAAGELSWSKEEKKLLKVFDGIL